MAVAAAQASYAARFEDFLVRRGGEPSWLTGIRRSAMDAFTRLGLPTTRDEEWRFTSVAPVASQAFGEAGLAGARGAGQHDHPRAHRPIVPLPRHLVCPGAASPPDRDPSCCRSPAGRGAPDGLLRRLVEQYAVRVGVRDRAGGRVELGGPVELGSGDGRRVPGALLRPHQRRGGRHPVGAGRGAGGRP